MSTSPACPLCHGTSTLLYTLDTEALRREYQDTYQVQIVIPPDIAIEYRRCGTCDLLFFSPAICGDAQFYRQLQQHPWYYKQEKQEFEQAARHVRPEDSVLEIGAGKGVFAGKILHARSYVGLETSPDAISTAAARGVRLLPERIEDHAVAHAGRYDVVCTFQVLEHVSDPRSFLASAKRCLHPDGRLIVSVPSEDSFAAIAYWDVLNMPPHHITRWSDKALKSIARVLDFELVDIEHEPLAQEHARMFARYAAEYALARKQGHQPRLLDPALRTWRIRLLSNAVASLMKHAFFVPELKPVGHSVVAVYRNRAMTTGA